ncbi:ATP dependent DNA ligase [Sporolactobacillus sp. CQH2019]|uniref:ATP dependent DNA ligase n=1 Tax=Sporolactobacillus sp. CQH2019 TaxID=3023512 RepID=UPI003FD116C2
MLLRSLGGLSYREGSVHSILLGLYNTNDQLIYIGHCGPGKLTAREWQLFAERAVRLGDEHTLFVNFREKKNICWLKPLLTVKMHYIEWSSGHFLWQPTLQAVVEENPSTCRMEPS